MSKIPLEAVAGRYESITPHDRFVRFKRLNSYRSIFSPADWEWVRHVLITMGYDDAIKQAEKIIRSQDLTIDNPEEPV